jgi:hypothetical protein
MYALIENGEITRINIDFPAVVNGVRFTAGSTLQDVLANGLVPIVGDEPAYNPERQRLAGPQYVVQGQQVNRVFTVEAIPDEEKAGQVRSERNTKLAATDWTQGKDIPDNVSSTWAAYRQALRNVPAQAGFPWEVTWPTQPE